MNKMFLPFLTSINNLTDLISSELKQKGTVNSFFKIASSYFESEQDGTLLLSLCISFYPTEDRMEEDTDVYCSIFEEHVIDSITKCFKVTKIPLPNLEDDMSINVFTPKIYAGDGWYITVMSTDFNTYITIILAQL